MSTIQLFFFSYRVFQILMMFLTVLYSYYYLLSTYIRTFKTKLKCIGTRCYENTYFEIGYIQKTARLFVPAGHFISDTSHVSWCSRLEKATATVEIWGRPNTFRTTFWTSTNFYDQFFGRSDGLARGLVWSIPSLSNPICMPVLSSTEIESENSHQPKLNFLPLYPINAIMPIFVIAHELNT